MKVFLTGATGSIGNVILRKLIAAGHTVTSPVRDQSKGERLVQEFGAHCQLVLLDLGGACREALIEAAKGHDGIIHTAFVYTHQTEVTEQELVDTLLVAGSINSQDSHCAVVISSGSVCIGSHDQPFTEATPPANVPDLDIHRLNIEQTVVNAKTESLSTAVIRPGHSTGSIRDQIRQNFTCFKVAYPDAV